MTGATLFIGNKNYSSWSMRPWLALKWGAIPFEERIIALGGEGYGKSEIKDVRAVSPSGRVPALHLGGAVIYESLAICEWAGEQAPSLWPADPVRRAQARAAASEMHAGFGALRRDLSMNIRRRVERAPDWPEDTQRDLTRLFEMWAGMRADHGGPWLFGARSIADAMFAPVVTRLRTYAVETPQIARAYSQTLFADTAYQAWERGALGETWTIPQTDELYP